jgi:hypothetical protein
LTVALDPETIERETAILPIRSVAHYLQEALGQQVVAYLAGLRNPKTVGRWAAGKSVSRSAIVHMRLRYGYEATRLLTDAFGAETAPAWLFGSNTRLDDEAPAYLPRYAMTPEDVRLIVPAARAFAGAAA